MADLLFQRDSYLREFEAVITRIKGNSVFLDRTAFHPRPSGGLDADRGVLVLGEARQVRVVDVLVEENDVAHVVDDSSILSVGMKVRGIIDWERRYKMMRLHTASHILATVLYEKYGAKVTGGHIGPDMARDDFEIDTENWREAIIQALEETNRIAARCIEVKVYWLPRTEALKIPGIVKLADRLPPDIDMLRIVEIPGVDIQADGGPHVKNTCEIGGVELVNLESRGKRRKRVYYRLKA